MKIRLGDLRRLLRETDAHMMGDNKGNGLGDPENSDDALDIAKHLRTTDVDDTMGTPPKEEMGSLALAENLEMPFWMRRELKAFFLQEEPAAASGSDPRDAKGFYAPFDMTKDHTGTDDPTDAWYRSPGRAAGGDGDPFRGSDPYAQLGFHPPAAQNDPTTTPPSVSGEEGIAARRTPPIWQLSAGSDTSKVLGANAKPDSGGVDSSDEQEEAGEGGTGEADNEEGAEGEDEG